MAELYTKASKFLSLILRHKPEEIGIALDAHGWADVEALMDNLGTENPGGLDISVIVQNQLTGNTPGK